jgi:multidrug resistance efflux pump
MPNTKPTISLNPSSTTEYLLGNPPTWMMHYGISAIAVVLSVLLAMSYFISFPDTVEAKIKLVTANPPIRLMAKASGRVLAFQVQDKESVNQGELLAVLENTARWQDVLQLETALKSENFRLPEDLQLGELQNDYSIFAQHHKDFAYFKQKNGVATKINYLEKQIEQLNAMNQNPSLAFSLYKTN